MRHNASNWARHDARPYDNMSMDHGAYDRSRSYDSRSDSRRYYDDRHDNSYGSEYDGSSYASNSGNGQAGTRDYRDLPSYGRADSYGSSR